MDPKSRRHHSPEDKVRILRLPAQPQHLVVPSNVRNADNYYQHSGGPFHGGAAKNPGPHVFNFDVSGPGVNHNNVVNTVLKGGLALVHFEK